MYNIKMVSQLVDIPAVTIRAWERRYQVLHPKRTESGHRLYTDQDIEDLKWLKQQTEEMGLNISQAMLLLKKKNEQPSGNGDYSNWVLQLYEAVHTFNTEKAHKVLDLCFAMYPFEHVFHYTFKPLLDRIEGETQKGILPVAVMKISNQIFLERISPFYRLFPVQPKQPRAVLLCPGKEDQPSGGQLLYLFLRRRGVDVIYLGSNNLLKELDSIIEECSIQLIGVSLAAMSLEEETLSLLTLLSKRHPKLQMMLEGQALRNVPKEWEACFIGDTLEMWEKWWSTIGLDNL